MRTLVTGAEGFIGGRVCQKLFESGAEVHAVSRRWRMDDDKTRWAQADLTDADAVRRAFEDARPDVVHHLGGFVSGAREVAAVHPAVVDNVLGTANVLVAAARLGCPVVLAGSMEEPVGDEIAASPYAASKQAAASFGRMLAALQHVPVLNLRVFMVYGPGQRDRTKLVPYVVTTLLRGERPALSTGTRAIDWVYVDDVAEAFVATGPRAASLSRETVDIGSGTLVTVRSLVEQLVELVDADLEVDFGAVPDRPLEVVRVADVGRTRALIGWEPRTSLAEGLHATVDAYRRDLQLEDAVGPGAARFGSDQ
jgi:UDP-glucose 4-epimerase